MPLTWIVSVCVATATCGSRARAAGRLPRVVRRARPEAGVVGDDPRVASDLHRARGVAEQVRVVALLPDEHEMRRGHEDRDDVDTGAGHGTDRCGRSDQPAWSSSVGSRRMTSELLRSSAQDSGAIDSGGRRPAVYANASAGGSGWLLPTPPPQQGEAARRAPLCEAYPDRTADSGKRVGGPGQAVGAPVSRSRGRAGLRLFGSRPPRNAGPDWAVSMLGRGAAARA